MFELFSVINIVVASFMIGNDYDSIAAYQNDNSQVDSAYVIVDDADDVELGES